MRHQQMDVILVSDDTTERVLCLSFDGHERECHRFLSHADVPFPSFVRQVYGKHVLYLEIISMDAVISLGIALS